MAEVINGFRDGDRVRHDSWGTTGTVQFHYEADPQADPVVAEVVWDGSFVSDELDSRLAGNLTLI